MTQISTVSNIHIKGISVASRLMLNSKVMIALLMTASLVMSPIVVADETEDIPTNAVGTGVHDSLVAALSQAGLVSTLSGDGPFTVFAPTDDAFAAAGIDLASFDTDEENATLIDILTYHVVSGQVLSSDLSDGMTATALNGDELSFTVTADAVTVSGATVTSADVMASNGVIHVIDTVLMPPVPYTGIGICYNTATHTIVAGSTYEECNAYMYVVDFEMGGQTYTGCYNTISHALTDVTQAVCESYVWTPPVDIPTSASATGIHTSLVAALTAADLVSALQADGPFTVFAPTDDAFTAAGIDLASFDTDEEIAALADILTYHVVSGQVMSTDLTDGMAATALNGDELSFTVSADAVTVSGATVTLADVPASNGVIHVIDTVLTPPADLVDIPTSASATGIHTSLVAALTAADLVSALQADGPFTVFAPTDDAFTAAGIDLATFDTDEEIAALADILTYHVVSGQVMSTDLTDGMTATALNGDELSFTVSADAVTVSGATVTTADVMTSNGVIHVIDTVLMPPADPPVIPEGCDYLVGIDDSGYAFDQTSLEIAVGETVCWMWTDSSMPHNVAETASAEDTTRLVGGLYSGPAASTVDYRVTFDANETFTYICEPHASMNMNGVVVVGTGIEDVPEPVEKDTDATPGFGGALLVLAVMGAVLVTTQRSKLD
ncbi:MAG: hypothetical protein CBC89_01085 [Euryarchaeota archaeon TMED129]|nr:MAG: hypothetical protein CBC89_01085 [Euryarchaeota archaeon TMED129]